MLTPAAINSDPTTDDRVLRVRGTVQGVGFRPFVARMATELGVNGWVRNDSQGVLIRATGAPDRIDRFAEALRDRAPAAARVMAIEPVVAEPEFDPAGASFVILDSAPAAEEVETSVPADLALCDDCRRELADPANRRAGYVFINCTQCGPRYSIIESLPYDRPRTTMRAFRMCPVCHGEYRDPLDRRFHAEPNACPACGPRLSLTDAKGKSLTEPGHALEETLIALRNGRIAAVKGIGGFHLMCDATNETAVAELRRRKHREEKPLAVMFRDLDAVRDYARVSPQAAALLVSPAAPIVLVPAREDSRLARSVAPENPWIGALVASTPLHVQMLGGLHFPVVATSANLSEEPLCIDDAEARERLIGIADIFLSHNRPIARPVDDSVVRFSTGGTPILLRRARGYAPSPLQLPSRLPHSLLCVGAHMKNTVAVAAGDRVVLSPHIGDLGGTATRAVFDRTIETLTSLFGSQPGGVVCDKHPDYASTQFAESTGLPRCAVQHHLAHVLAVLLEHGQAADDVLGLSWDGTGYGEDGTIWGGEFILLQGGRASRFARLRPFQLLGGEAAVRDVRRIAVSLAAEVGSDAGARIGSNLGFTGGELAVLRTMMDQELNAPVCSSMGRLFDGVGALLGLRRYNAFEGQTPMAVEIAALRATHTRAELPFRLRPADFGAIWDLDWEPAVQALLTMPSAETAQMAAAFHRGLAAAATKLALLAGARTVVLSGGCFQNAMLRDLTVLALERAGFTVLAARELPPNDGAIAAGQALGALWNLTTVELPSAAPKHG